MHVSIYICFSNRPKYFIFQLYRVYGYKTIFNPTPEEYAEGKRLLKHEVNYEGKFEFEETLDLSSLTKQFYDNPKRVPDIDGLVYELRAIVIHNRSSESSGHFWCYVNLKDYKFELDWYKIDDAQVTGCTFTQIKEKKYDMDRLAGLIYVQSNISNKGLQWMKELDGFHNVLQKINSSPSIQKINPSRSKYYSPLSKKTSIIANMSKKDSLILKRQQSQVKQGIKMEKRYATGTVKDRQWCLGDFVVYHLEQEVTAQNMHHYGLFGIVVEVSRYNSVKILDYNQQVIICDQQKNPIWIKSHQLKLVPSVPEEAKRQCLQIQTGNSQSVDTYRTMTGHFVHKFHYGSLHEVNKSTGRQKCCSCKNGCHSKCGCVKVNMKCSKKCKCGTNCVNR